MDKKTSEQYIGKLVEAVDIYDGSYIGILESTHSARTLDSKPCEKANVRILACTKYPSQMAQVWPQHVFPRKPYKYSSLATFDLNNLTAHECAMTISQFCSDYYTFSIVDSLTQAIMKANGVERLMLDTHYQNFRNLRDDLVG